MGIPVTLRIYQKILGFTGVRTFIQHKHMYNELKNENFYVIFNFFNYNYYIYICFNDFNTLALLLKYFQLNLIF